MTYREQLERDGYFVVRGILSRENIDVALDRLRRVAAHMPDFYAERLPKWAAVAGAETHPDPLYRYDWIDGITFFDAVLWKHIAAHPKLLAVARQVVGPRVFPTNGGGFFMKPPGSPKSVPWHQDASPFLETPEHGKARNPLLFDFWLGLTEATAEMGCLRVIPGSQHRGRLEHLEHGGLLPELDIAAHGYTEADIHTIETGPGDLIVWHQDMIHGSNSNRSGNSRIAVASIYHGEPEENLLRENHRKGAIRRRPQLCDGEQICDLPDPLTPPWE